MAQRRPPLARLLMVCADPTHPSFPHHGCIHQVGGGPGEASRGQEKPGKARKGQERPGEARRGQEKPGEAREGQERPREARRSRERPGEARRGQEKPGEARRSQERPGEARRGQEKPGQGPKLATVTHSGTKWRQNAVRVCKKDPLQFFEAFWGVV